MYIEKISLENFRNYNKLDLEIYKNVNVFYGQNASGKTNILEAIYLSAITKSYRTSKEQELIKFKDNYTRINVNYVDNIGRKNEISVYIEDGVKVIKENDIIVKKLSEYIGKYNIVIFSPESMDIIKGSPKNRRRFLNILISQISKAYVIKLQEYNKLLALKNNLLKLDKDEIDYNYLEIIDEKLSEYIEYIVNQRSNIIERMNEKAKIIHSDITQEKEKIKIEYISDFLNINKKKVLSILKKNREYDIFRKNSTKGIQRDDLKIFTNELEVNVFGSQGQNRTALLSIKLSEFEILKEEKEETPILLLDDVLSELDNLRIKYLLKYIKNYQTIITTTDIEILKNLDNVNMYKVENGRVEKKNN